MTESATLSPELIDEVGQLEHRDYLENPAYAAYMKMNKVLVGVSGARQLEEVYSSLRDEVAPRFLTVAGWAAAEIALVRTDMDEDFRLSYLDAAVDTWIRSLDREIEINPCLPRNKVEPANAYRTALAVAIVPLLQDFVRGDVRKRTCEQVFETSLEVAKANAQRMRQLREADMYEGVRDHSGFGYECNALLAFNRMLSQTWFAIPAIARADTGYHHRNQTHDLMVVHQKYGLLKTVTPVEIKAKAGKKDRRRYRALLVEGKMHLSVDANMGHEHTLDAITAVHEGTADEADEQIADSVTECFKSMVRDYYAGDVLGELAGRRTVTTFHDSSRVFEHLGVAALAA
jgi:hypothetical protein